MEEAGLLIDRNFRHQAISGFNESPTDHQSITNKQRPQISTFNGNDYINFTENPTAVGMTAFQPQPPVMNATVDVFNVPHNMELLSFPKQPPPLRSPPPDMFHSFLAVNQKHEPGSSSTSYNPLSQDFSGRYDGQSPSDMTFHPQNLISDQPRPNRHGLSLSLSPHNPSELRVQAFQSSSADELAYGLGYCNIGGNKPSSSSSSPCFRPYELKNSKYLIAAQELLYEFCNLGTKQTRNHQKRGKNSTNDDSSAPSIYSTSDVVELQKRKCKLISMLEEVDRRHKIYREQMRTLVSSFESVAGEGSADVYSSLAAKAMSKHFRCLRDAIVSQLSSTRKALGERDTTAPGTTKGETPRLRILDQCIRQQKALQNMGVLENHPWRPQRGLPERAVSVLRAWLFEHFLHPYPSDVDKHILARQTGLSRSQVSNWFINARVRLWKPMVEEMYTEEQKEHEKGEASNQDHKDRNPNPNSHLRDHVQHNPDSLSTDELKMKATAVAAALGGYSHHGRTSYDFSEGGEVTLASQRQYNGNRGVSLTLGLHQQSLNLNQYNQHSLFFPRDAGHHHHQLEDVQYSFMDGGTDVQDGSSSYNNGGHHLVGGQLLHDFVG